MHGDRTRRRLLHAESLVLAVWRARPDVGHQVRRRTRQTALSWSRREALDPGRSAARERAGHSASERSCFFEDAVPLPDRFTSFAGERAPRAVV